MKTNADEPTTAVDVKRKTMLLKMGLSTRAKRCLNAAEIYTIGELMDYGVHNLHEFRNLGTKTIKEIEEMLENYDTRR